MWKLSEELDPIIHQPTRLKIITNLFVVVEADMIFLKNKTGLTWGNISSHVTKLEEAEYLEVEKKIIDKKTRTTLKLTEKGIKAFEKYRNSILEMLG